MIVVDSSVWIDFFRDLSTPQVELLDRALGHNEVFAADLVVVEVLQGFRDDRSFDLALDRLSLATPLDVSGQVVAIASARNYRELHRRGHTIRKTIDVLIATRCILDDLPLLFSDRDFLPFVQHLGLRSALDDHGVN